MSEGYAAAKAVADKLKLEQEQQGVDKAKSLEKVKSDLAEVSGNSDLAKMYNDSASIGSENLGGSSPLLKVHAVGKSSSNQLADGSEPEDGMFFYKPTQEQFDSIECHILTISKGFRAPSLENPEKLTFNQIIGGLIIQDGNYKPFIMYVSGKKLSGMWEFGKEAAQYTHAKPVSIPMFALTINLTTRSEKNSIGKSWLIDFEIKKNKDGSLVLVTDPGEFQFLKDSVDTVKQMIDNIIKSKVGNGALPEDADVIDAEDDTQGPSEDIPFNN